MMTQSRQRSLDQKRAAMAWERVRAVTQARKEYLSLVRGAPADVQANGLGQTLAFWKAKRKPEYDAAYDAVAGWLQAQLQLGPKDVLEWITREATSSQYRRATAEAMAFLVWLKRFAEAEGLE